MPTILSIFLPRQRSRNKSIDARNKTRIVQDRRDVFKHNACPWKIRHIAHGSAQLFNHRRRHSARTLAGWRETSIIAFFMTLRAVAILWFPLVLPLSVGIGISRP